MAADGRRKDDHGDAREGRGRVRVRGQFVRPSVAFSIAQLKSDPHPMLSLPFQRVGHRGFGGGEEEGERILHHLYSLLPPLRVSSFRRVSTDRSVVVAAARRRERGKKRRSGNGRKRIRTRNQGSHFIELAALSLFLCTEKGRLPFPSPPPPFLLGLLKS